jgi:lysyl-tRNA synthetase class 2
MKQTLIVFRSQTVKQVRRFFDDQGFTEMLTPRLVGLPGQEPYLDPMWTEVHRARMAGEEAKTFPAALITSPEYAMKKLLAAGFDKIYDLGPCFRDGEPWDGSHDPEFLLLEWYRRDAGLEELMVDTEALVRYVAEAMDKGEMVAVAPFRRLTVAEAMKQYAGVDFAPLLGNREALAEVVRAHGQTVAEGDSWDDLFFKVFLTEVEPNLGWNENHSAWLPTFLYNYPASMAALARKDPVDPRFALRTELYIGDLELANGFAELCDPVEQRARFEEERGLRASLGKPTWELDERFLAELPKMGNAAGIALGVDRLVMLLTATTSISDLLPVPVRERFTN